MRFVTAALFLAYASAPASGRAPPISPYFSRTTASATSLQTQHHLPDSTSRRERSWWGLRYGWRQTGLTGLVAFVDPTELANRLQHLPMLAYGSLCVGCNMIPFFPGQALNVGAGVIYGFRRGYPLVCTSQALSATIAFVAARGFRRTPHFEWLLARAQKSDAVRKVINGLATVTSNRQAAAGAGAGGSGMSLASLWAAFLTVLLLRQAPIVPFSISNYILGALSELPLPAFALGTLVGCAWGNAIVVAAGAAGKEIGLDGVSGQAALAAAVAALGTVALGALLLKRAGEVAAVEGGTPRTKPKCGAVSP